MGRFNGVLIATDYDDTLVNREKQVPQRSLDALRRFTDQGGRFTIASGRGAEAIRPCLEGLPVNAPVIVANGTQIYDFAAEKLVYEAYLPQEARADFAQVLRDFPRVAVEVYARGQLYCVNPNLVTAEHLRITRQTAREVRLEEIPAPWVYAKFEEENAYLRRIQDHLRERFPGRYEAIFSNTYLLEVAGKGSGKGPGVLRLAELLGVRREDIYCAGDNENDLSMLRAAAVSFTPEHSTPIAMETAGVIVCDCDEGALADVVAYLEQKYENK